MEKNWFNKEVNEVEKELKTNLANGLTPAEVEEKRNEYGFNELKAKKEKKPIRKVFRTV